MLDVEGEPVQPLGRSQGERCGVVARGVGDDAAPGILVTEQMRSPASGNHVPQPLFAQGVVEIQSHRSQQYIIKPLSGILPIRYDSVNTNRQP